MCGFPTLHVQEMFYLQIKIYGQLIMFMKSQISIVVY